MCTAIRFNEYFFGRTLDFERSFGEQMLVLPRETVGLMDCKSRYAMMGIGVLCDGGAMLFDGVNEWGLASAALNFSGYACYGSVGGRADIGAGGLISLVLGLCRSVGEAREMLGGINITRDGQGSAPLHWMVSDGREAMVVEAVAEGIRLYDNPVGVLTNAPDFVYHMTRLGDIAHLSPASRLADYSRGMGAIGLPGDFSSASRFLRAAFICRHGTMPDDTDLGVNIAFDILSSLSVPRGCVITHGGEAAYTRYTSVINMSTPTYYLTTATCRTVHRLRLTDRLINGSEIQRLALCAEPHFVDM